MTITRVQQQLLVIVWLLAGCWLMTNISKKSYRPLPNKAEIARNMKVMDEMGIPPRLKAIILCESDGIHSNADGSVLQGKVDPDDTGIAQINKRFHLQKSISLGYDIETLEGNLGYALYLFEREGDKPWDSSGRCWRQSATYIAYNR